MDSLHLGRNAAAVITANLGALSEEVSSLADLLRNTRAQLRGDATSAFDESAPDLWERLARMGEICSDALASAGVVNEALGRRASTCEPVEKRAPNGQSAKRILLIEDLDILRRTTTRVLSPPHTVVGASDGAQALELLESDQDFDVILCDVLMPGVNGVAFAERLKTCHPELICRVLFLSGGDLNSTSLQALHKEGFTVIEKPVPRDVLLGFVDKVVPQLSASKPGG